MRTNSIERATNLHRPQIFSITEEDEYIQNNMTIDFYFGFDDILSDFVTRCPEFGEHLIFLRGMKPKDLLQEVSKARNKSVLLTTIMLTGRCNANCNICCTDRRFKKKELSLSEIESILIQIKSLGCRTVYVPGEGEPFLDEKIWDILEIVTSLKLDIIIFTNGLLLSKDNLAFEQWGLSAEDAIKRFASYPVFIYHKLWSLNSIVLEQMMNVPADTFCFEKYTFIDYEEEIIKSLKLPRSLILLLKHFPREQLGIESVVMKSNIPELRDTIIPFVKNTGIKFYLEPLLHSGRYLGKTEHDVDSDELATLQPWITRLSCRRVGYMVMVHNTGFLSFGIQVPLHLIMPERMDKFTIRDDHKKIKEIFKLIHTNKFLVKGRYAIDRCICEEISREIATKGVSSFLCL